MALTLLKVTNAEADLETISQVVNGALDLVVTNRNGDTLQTVKKMLSLELIENSMSILGDFNLKSLGYDAPPAPGVYFGVGGISLSHNTLISSPVGGADNDNQRSMLLLVAETTDDGNSEEQVFCILTTIKTGYRPPFIPNHDYAVGDNYTVDGENAIYRVTVAGTSGATPPTGKGANILNGDTRVRWINDAAVGAKLPFYNEVRVQAGAGSAWAQVNNFHLEAGYAADFACATEIDITNNTGFNSVIGAYNKLGLWIAGQGANTSTAALQISSANTANDAFLWGAYFAGARLATRAVLCFDASSAIGIGFGANAGGVITDPTYTTATIRDKSLTPTFLSLGGKYSSAAISITSPTSMPSAIAISGPKSGYSIYDFSAAQAAFSAGGTYVVADIALIGSAPAAITIGGTNRTLCGIFEGSTSPFGMRFGGSYTQGPLQLNGLQIAADEAAAAGLGLIQGAVYRTADGALRVKVS